MGTANLVLLLVGGLIILLGILTFINPQFARWINAPGGPRLKAIIALIVGCILVVLGMILQLPG